MTSSPVTDASATPEVVSRKGGRMPRLQEAGLILGARMHPFIVTLATMSIFRGIALVSVREGSLPFGDHILPPAFTDRFIAYTVNYTRAGGRMEFLQPVPLVLMLVILVFGWV